MHDHEGDTVPHGAHGRTRTWPEHWAAFKRSPFLPAVVLMFILAAAAGLFAGSYTYAMANPAPRHIPTAVVTTPAAAPQHKAFVVGMEKALDASLRLTGYATYDAARNAVDEQREYAVLRARGSGVELDVAGASGASVAQLLSEAARKVGPATGVHVTVRDIKPLQEGDPRGLALFYISLAAVIIGFVGAIQLSVHARGLNPPERIAFILAYALLGGFAIAAVADWWLGALRLPFVESWMILALTMFTSGMVFTMFNTLMGRWAMIPTWGLMVLLGNPSSGGAVSWPLLPSVLGAIGRWLPPGASVNAQHTAVYFGGHQHAFPFLVLAGWSAVSCTVFWVWRHRHPGGREPSPAPAHAADT
ncbi:ABC transporter permease [Streptomyces sp. BHT-5-2]|uniref:ABC transporter permease n=1 Tax=unclassified Streptomyces TaxID=2593676 RepID=UPI001C8EFF0E|nr:ABC transporter permease [Streptomyces sp. BHT-5-2]QZL02729.1 ABC transporter permease [Streptomyces sp. BHT-5-2]